jgi:hypothetical protein
VGEDKVKLEINWVQAASGALAAMSSAVLLSTVGVAGTLIGAALGSIAFTIGSAVYSYYLRVSRARVAAAARLRAEWVRGRRTEHGMDLPPPVTPEMELPPEPGAAPPPRWRHALGAVPWARVAVAAAGLFVVVMGVILGFESLTGRPVAAYTGGAAGDSTGTSIPGMGGSAHRSPARAPSPAASATGTPTPSAAPSEAPSVEATPSPSATPTVPEETPTEAAPSTTPAPQTTPAEPVPSASPAG